MFMQVQGGKHVGMSTYVCIPVDVAPTFNINSTSGIEHAHGRALYWCLVTT